MVGGIFPDSPTLDTFKRPLAFVSDIDPTIDPPIGTDKGLIDFQKKRKAFSSFSTSVRKVVLFQ